MEVLRNKNQTPHLSYRQKQVLRYLIRGYNNKTIAYHLGIELVTVKMHIGSLFKKLGVINRTEAAVLGVTMFGIDSLSGGFDDGYSQSSDPPAEIRPG
ncbi:MAG: helix-turn-helix transcriptional regulator [Methanobacterium sp.]|nr:helix-turn-helix transcriptional regulator [Methanobacterium sp.]